MPGTVPEAATTVTNGVAEHIVSERAVGLILAGLTILCIVFIVVCDYRIERRLVVSINLSRFILDGQTFTTERTVALVIVDSTIFSIVASNYIYATVTAFSCIMGPVINLAERYGRVLDRQLSVSVTSQISSPEYNFSLNRSKLPRCPRF